MEIWNSLYELYQIGSKYKIRYIYHSNIGIPV